MQRDKELIRAILIFSAEFDGKYNPLITPEVLPERFHQIEFNDFCRHCQMIIDQGLAKGSVLRSGFCLTAITWAGYDFLENARDNKIWQTATKAAGHLSWGVFVNVLTETATAVAKKALQID
jgi:hypothetical protein